MKSITDIDLKERVRMILPTQEEFRSAAYRAKKKGIPVAPRRLEDLDFSLLNTDSRNMENYILSHDPESKIVLFGTEKTVQTFIAAKFKTMDGTFKIAPKNYFQVLIFLALVSTSYVPCFFALLTNKSRNSYDKVFSMIQHQITKRGFTCDFGGHFFMMDFEYAMRAALSAVWPPIQILGCYFHWTQLIIKRVRKSGSAQAYTKIHKCVQQDVNSYIQT